MSFRLRLFIALLGLAALAFAAPVLAEPQQDDGLFATPDVCEIDGQVAQKQDVVRSPYSDGTPSLLAV